MNLSSTVVAILPDVEHCLRLVALEETPARGSRDGSEWRRADHRSSGRVRGTQGREARHGRAGAHRGPQPGSEEGACPLAPSGGGRG